MSHHKKHLEPVTASPKRLLIVYATTEGQTRKVARRMADALREAGAVVDSTADPAQMSLKEQHYDGIIVGASVHQGHYQTSIIDFVRANRVNLDARPSAFFSVCLSAAVHSSLLQEEAQGYIESMMAETGWQPGVTTSIAGALRHAKYDYYQRLVLMMLSTQLGPKIVGVGDAEYTNWAAVESFAREFLKTVVAPARNVAIA